MKEWFFKLSFIRHEYYVDVFIVCVIVAAASMMIGCESAVAPVRYQVAEVLVTKPCFAVSQAPAPAIEITSPRCTLSREECVRAAQADINELQRETRQYRTLFKECTK